MSVSGIESTGPFGTTAVGADPATSATAADKDMFLQLLVAQMRYQDPANPTDSSQFLAQTAQFTALEKMQQVADQTAQLVALQVAFGASSMVGRTVSYPDADGATVTGTVGSVRFEATGPMLQVDGVDVPLGAILSVTSGNAATPPASPDSSSADGPVARPVV